MPKGSELRCVQEVARGCSTEAWVQLEDSSAPPIPVTCRTQLSPSASRGVRSEGRASEADSLGLFSSSSCSPWCQYDRDHLSDSLEPPSLATLLVRAGDSVQPHTVWMRKQAGNRPGHTVSLGETQTSAACWLCAVLRAPSPTAWQPVHPPVKSGGDRDADH